MSTIEEAREQAREALELVHAWRQREQAWDTPRALGFEKIGQAIRTLLDATEPRPITDEMVLAGLNATEKPESRAPDLSFWATGKIATMRAEHQLEILRAEQGETEGRREFAAAYRARNGNVIPLGAETVVQDDANAVRAEFEREDPEGPTYFVATRILPPWLPVPDTTNNESEGKA